MDNIIIVGIVVVILGLVVFYVVRSKKKGKKCIGCPNSCGCNGDCSKKG